MLKSPGHWPDGSERADVLATAVPTDRGSGNYRDQFPDLHLARVRGVDPVYCTCVFIHAIQGSFRRRRARRNWFSTRHNVYFETCIYSIDIYSRYLYHASTKPHGMQIHDDRCARRPGMSVSQRRDDLREVFRPAASFPTPTRWVDPICGCLMSHRPPWRHPANPSAIAESATAPAITPQRARRPYLRSCRTRAHIAVE